MKRLAVLIIIASCTPVDFPEVQEPETRADSTETVTLSGVPIDFEVSVEEWEDEDIDINL